MSALPAIHLSIVQPLGYVFSLGLLDQARYFRWQFRRLGAQVTMAKNRLRHDAVNFVFGAHLGFDAAQCARHACIFVNLEQLGAGGAPVPPEYLALLRQSAVVDYDAGNLGAYAADPQDVPLVPFLHAPYLEPGADDLPLEQRPIDLLFIGGMNERRQAWIQRIEALGWNVSVFDSPLYGEERDAYIRQAKSVLNCHFYETSRFEQVRAAHCLSLGTPVISERTERTGPHAAFEDSVLWLQGGELEQFFREDFGTPAYFDVARAAVARFREADPIDAYAELVAFAAGFARGHRARREPAPWRPASIHLGSGKDYLPGWLNLDVLDRSEPDALLDLSRPVALPLQLTSPTQGPVLLEAGSVARVRANNVLEHVADLPTLMTNCLALLAEGGDFEIEVPYEKALTAWQDPTHVRAMNENSWLYYTDWFWYLGWFEHRFGVVGSTWLDASLRECSQDKAAFMRLVLRKQATTPAERTTARTLQAPVRLPDDDVPAAWRRPLALSENAA